MKKLLLVCIGICSFKSIAQVSQLPSMMIAGIEVRNIPSNEDILRSVIYKSLVNSKKYVVNDRYDVAEKLGDTKMKECLGKDCMGKVGKQLSADFAISASYEGLGDRILISMKIVNVQTGEIDQNEIQQFENQPRELNRMTDIMIYKLLKTDVDLSVYKALFFKDGPTASSGLGKMNNSGPRIGFAVPTGENAEFFTRNEREGGLGTLPVLFNIGYQLEVQYAGSEKFSGLFEFLGNVAGMEHGSPIPSLAIMHGVRFGKGAWEIAMGPSFSMKRLASGTTDYDGNFRTYQELYALNAVNAAQMSYFKRPDTRGATYFSTNFIFAVGKTFRPGALNVPLNFYASMNKYGTTYGVSLGINITRSRKYTYTK
ncbi:hypothetical protein [Fluviicola taffensis]|nr:hypothetical protein [Fluviicola taffensis]